MSIGTALLYSVLGIAIVFFALILLMIIIKITVALTSEKKPAPVPVTAKPTVVKAPVQPVAPGTAGELKLYDTNPAVAAMIMAIVADSLKKPLNELRFISIREIKE